MSDELVYDSGALIAAERGSRSLWALHAEAVDRGFSPLIPAPVLAQVWRGGPQARLSRLLQACEIVPFDEGWARRVGAVCGLSGTSDVVDASVAVLASEVIGIVVTSDVADLELLLGALGATVPVVRI